MRNLRLSLCATQHFPDIQNVEHFCVNALQGVIYVYNDGILYCVSQERIIDIKSFNLNEQYCEDDLKLAAINYNSILNVICLATLKGDVLTVDYDAKSIQVMGTVDSGVKAMEWSPDEELLIVITGVDTVITMTSEFDPLGEVPFHQDSFGEREFITVGWGKKETQFHGSEGKAAARAAPTVVEKQAEKDDFTPQVSWRGDGTLYAVSIVKPDTGARCIRIFNREGILQSTSETVPCLEMSLSWRPSGNLIASTQVLPNKYQVVFFEKNGLRHGEFTLPFSPGEGVVRQLSWNTASDVLTVWYENDNDSYLQLWTVGNYHWYLKQSFIFSKTQQLFGFQWDPESNLKLHLLYSGIHYSVMEWSWGIDHSCVIAPNNLAGVAVIDGKDILVTEFATKIIPPPMCMHKIQFPKAVNQVIFGPDSSPNDLCAVLCDGEVAMYSNEEKTVKWIEEATGVKEELGTLANLHHWIWFGDQHFLCIATIGSTSHILNIEVDPPGKLQVRSAVNVNDTVLSLTRVSGQKFVLVQTISREILMYKPEDNSLKEVMTAPERLVQTSVYSPEVSKEQPVVIGLSPRSRLYINSVETANNVTSMLVLPHWLLLTTSAHKLFALQLTGHETLENALQNVDNSSIGGRRIERGARLVVAAGSRVVLQMPRGNLETVTPRALVMEEAMQLMNSCQFVAAYELLRRQRINLNILVDNDWDCFFKSLPKFVAEVPNPSWFSVFLAELSNEDVTSTIYSQFYPNRFKISGKEKHAEKVRLVCRELRSTMEKSPRVNDFYLPILTSFVAENDLKSALKYLVRASERGISRDAGLRHLTYMVDVNKLYDTALSLYDFDLVLMVASKSNKDPKEYLPFLNELRRLDDEYYRRYHIDVHLKNYVKAVYNLAQCSNREEECLKFVKDHNLEIHGVKAYGDDTKGHQLMIGACAEYLVTKQRHAEAVALFRRIGRLDDALEACKHAGLWRAGAGIMEEMNLSDTDKKSVWDAMAATLIRTSRFYDAAEVQRLHLGDFEEALATLVKGRLWDAALHFTVNGSSVPNLSEKHLLPALKEHAEQLCQVISKNKREFETHLNRLRVVREEKIAKAEGEAKNVEITPESDLFSDTSSTSGSFQSSGASGSGRSSRSSKNRRKLERKLLSLKEGSPFEDLALIRALHDNMRICLGLRREVHELCLALLNVKLDIRGCEVQQCLADALDVMEQAKTEIWLPDMYNPSTGSGESYGPNATANSIVAGTSKNRLMIQNCELLDVNYRIPPSAEKITWKLEILDLYMVNEAGGLY